MYQRKIYKEDIPKIKKEAESEKKSNCKGSTKKLSAPDNSLNLEFVHGYVNSCGHKSLCGFMGPSVGLWVPSWVYIFNLNACSPTICLSLPVTVVTIAETTSTILQMETLFIMWLL